MTCYEDLDYRWGWNIGSVLTPVLLAQGHQVTVLDSFMFRQNSLADCCHYESFQVVRGDCRNQSLVTRLIADTEVIIPLAALVGAPLCPRDAIGAQTINADAVRMLCRIASKEQWIILPTTNSGYGIGEKDKQCTEESPLRPISLYGRTKVEAEEAVLVRDNGISFRLATVFGMSPRMRVDLLVNDFVYRTVTDRAVVVFEGHFKRNYIHIRDVTHAFLHALTNFEVMRGKAFDVAMEDAQFVETGAIRGNPASVANLDLPGGADQGRYRTSAIILCRMLACTTQAFALSGRYSAASAS